MNQFSFQVHLLKSQFSFMKKLNSLAAFNDRDEIFEGSRDASSIAGIYSSYISKELSMADSGTVTRIGALIIEPGNNLYFNI